MSENESRVEEIRKRWLRLFHDESVPDDDAPAFSINELREVFARLDDLRRKHGPSDLDQATINVQKGRLCSVRVVDNGWIVLSEAWNSRSCSWTKTATVHHRWDEVAERVADAVGTIR